MKDSTKFMNIWKVLYPSPIIFIIILAIMFMINLLILGTTAIRTIILVSSIIISYALIICLIVTTKNGR